MGGKWAVFSLFLQQNYVSNTMWLQHLHKTNLWDPYLLNVMHKSNANIELSPKT